MCNYQYIAILAVNREVKLFSMVYSVLRNFLAVLLVYTIPAPVLSADSASSLRIVASRSVYPLVVDRLVEGFLKSYPNTKIKVDTFGSLEAISMARAGKADVLITYYPPEEHRLLKEGVVVNRIEFMFSSYAIFGPPTDELGLLKESTIQNVLKKIANNKAPFISSSKNGGTYHKLFDLWKSVGINPDWSWYEISNTTPLGAMRIAAEQEAYTFADIATYIQNRKELSAALVPLYQGGYELHKPFSIMQINYDKVKRPVHPLSTKFVEYITSDIGQQIISIANRDKFNAPVFFPAAHFDPTIIAKRMHDDVERANRNFYIVSAILLIAALMFFAMLYMFFRSRNFSKEKMKADVARGIAEQASNAKSEFLSKMSHELRTPMNAILGFSQILEMKEQDEDQRRNLQEIITAGEHLHFLIDDVLELSNIENNRVKILIEEVDVDGVIGDCITLCQEAVNKNQLNISVKGPMGYKVKADVTRLKEVLINLITNAAKYNKPNGTIILEKKVVDGDWLRLSVIDTGRGISKEKQKNLFEPFERLGLESSGIEGTGIGLVISKNLVELMSGRIGFESKPDQGSTFWVDFKLFE